MRQEAVDELDVAAAAIDAVTGAGRDDALLHSGPPRGLDPHCGGRGRPGRGPQTARASPGPQGRLTETRFIQEAWVGVKCTTNRGCRASHSRTFLCLCAA